MRFDKWRYNLSDSVFTVEWIDYTDRYLPFQTKMLSYIDYIKYGPDLSKFLIRQKTGYFVITIAINGALKSELKKETYLNLPARDVAHNGLVCSSFCYNSFKGEITDSIRIQKIKVTNSRGWQEKYLVIGYAFTDGRDLIEIIMSAPDTGREKADVLFNGVFTGFRFKGRSLYNPFEFSIN